MFSRLDLAAVTATFNPSVQVRRAIVFCLVATTNRASSTAGYSMALRTTNHDVARQSWCRGVAGDVRTATRQITAVHYVSVRCHEMVGVIGGYTQTGTRSIVLVDKLSDRCDQWNPITSGGCGWSFSGSDEVRASRQISNIAISFRRSFAWSPSRSPAEAAIVKPTSMVVMRPASTPVRSMPVLAGDLRRTSVSFCAEEVRTLSRTLSNGRIGLHRGQDRWHGNELSQQSLS